MTPEQEHQYYKSEFKRLMQEYRDSHNGEYPPLEEALQMSVPMLRSEE